jgi:glycosyltransferase involved in cell wall biosynthesis
MRVLFDTSAVLITKTGISNYVMELLNALRKSNLPVEVSELAYQPHFSRKSKLRTIDSVYRDIVWPSVHLSTHAKNKGVNLIHCPAFNFPLFTRQEMLITVHDIYSFVKPNDFNSWHGYVVRNYIAKAIKARKHLLVLTQFTKNEILNYFPLARAEYIHVVHSGVPGNRMMDRDCVLKQKVERKFNIHAPYILSVSTIEPRKNFHSLVKAFAILSDKIEHTLVLVGENGWNNKELYELLNRLNLKDRIRFTGFVSNEELNSLYSNAACFVFPSHYEGFGFTPLEAMRCGCPVVSSNASCMPEVLGKAAMYFDPKDEEEMATAIQKMLCDAGLIQKHSELGLQQSLSYNWDNTAINTYYLYQRIVGVTN